MLTSEGQQFYQYEKQTTTSHLKSLRGRHGRDHMVVGFITTYAISVCHH